MGEARKVKVAESDYNIYEKIVLGRGNYGIVCGCKKLQGGIETFQKLCVKIMDVSEQTKKDKPISETRIIEILKQQKFNSNLVQTYDVELKKEENKLYIIMEKCTSNLSKLQEEYKKNEKKFNDSELIDFLDQFLTGYQLLYDNNIIHRDLKPQNILISRLNNSKVTYKLADFGTGKVYKNNDYFISQVGTPVYSSPETSTLMKYDQELMRMIGDHRKDDPKFKSRVDVYSLGLILHELYFGQLPFKTQQADIANFYQNLKKNSFKLNEQGTEQIRELIERMIQYYPDKRISFPEIMVRCSDLKQRYPIQLNQVSQKIEQFPKQQQIIRQPQQQFQQQPQPQQSLPQANFNNSIRQFAAPYPNRIQFNGNPNGVHFSSGHNNTETFCKFILDYSNEILNNYEGLLTDNALSILHQVVAELQKNSNTFPRELLKELKNVYPYKITKSNSEVLKYHYCVTIGSLQQPPQQQYDLSNIEMIKSYLNQRLKDTQ